MKRRSFIKQSSALIATSTITPFDIGVNDVNGTRITILQTCNSHAADIKIVTLKPCIGDCRICCMMV